MLPPCALIYSRSVWCSLSSMFILAVEQDRDLNPIHKTSRIRTLENKMNYIIQNGNDWDLKAWTQYFVNSAAALVGKRNLSLSSRGLEYNELSAALYLSYKSSECRCVLCLHHDSVRQLGVSSDEFTARTEELGISGVNTSSGVAALDILLLSHFIRWSLQKDWTIHAFWQFGAYLRRFTGLYLATSGCIVLPVAFEGLFLKR